MTLKTPLALLLALGACTPDRPDGAYKPVYTDGGRPCRAGYCDDAAADEEDASDDLAFPEPDAGDGFELDAGERNLDDPLTGLEALYLMRVDYYSIVDERDQLNNRLRLKNRVSNLFLTELKSVDGKLRAREKMCFQSSAHKCLDGCMDWDTVYGPRLPNEYKKMAPIERTYTIATNADGSYKLTAERSLMPLGYSEPAPGNTPLPTQLSDPRVWQLTDVTTSARGVQTTLQGTLIAGPLRPALDCEVDSVMLFGTAFQSQLARLDAAALAERSPQVSTAGSKAQVLYVDGDPAAVCTEEELAGRSGGTETALVRFRKTDLRACPGSANEFEQLFPVTASERDIDPPTLTDAPP
ncbi:MAG: hypothetical protein ABW352_08905 [Polyangiales bacterium]